MGEGSSVLKWVFLGVAFVIFLVLAYFFLFGFGDGSSSDQEDNSNPGVSLNQSQNSANETKCSDYVLKEDCEGDSSGVAVAGHENWDVFGCDGDDKNCFCEWDDNSSYCKLGYENVSVESTGTVDLEALSISLTNSGCANITNTSIYACTIGISGTVKNSGSGISDTVSVQILDVTNLGSGQKELIKIFTFDGMESGAEESVSASYVNLTHGQEYWIRVFIDPLNQIEESDEDNNWKTEYLTV